MTLEPEMDCMSSIGGTKTVDLEPEPVPDSALCVLVKVRMVLIDPVGEPLSERLGMVTERSSASL